MAETYTPDPSLREFFERYMSLESSEERAAIINEIRQHLPESLAEFVLLVSNPRDDRLLEAPEVAIRMRGDAVQAVDDFTSPLDRMPASQSKTPSDASGHTGERIGPYKLLQQIGEGGFGTVYMAQQTEPVRRKVALKIIKPGMDSKEVIARFEAERQALAMMDHPNVAKVLDGGTTESGLPYFVMELVHGTPITEFCDENRLSNQDRLTLFVDVCRAIQHAHMRGLIHRDLKPTNVLVTMNDDKPMPKVIDFGVSKALSQPLTEKTMFTAYGQMVGTPLYMSPEQAQFSAKDVDVRSDVYSLGVLLYELLTGNTPFDREALRGTSLDEMRRMIREVNPPRPSVRISTLHAQDLSTVSDRRRADQRRLSHELKGELDWIVMKAVEKDRERRYESANEFAADVQHFLDDAPVKARPPSKLYLLGKFARRHRVALTTSTVVLVALIAGFSVAVWQAAVASREKNRAEREARIASAVNEFLNEDLLAQANPENQSDPDVKLRTVIDQAAEKLETRFKNQPLVEAAIRHTLAGGFLALDKDQQAQSMAQRAAELRGRILGKNDEATLESALLVAKALAGQGEYLASENQSRKVAKLAESSLGQQHPLTLEASRYLAKSLVWLARYEEAEETLSEVLRLQKDTLGEDHELTIRTLDTLCALHVAQGRYGEADSIIREVIKIRRRHFGKEHPHTLDAMNHLGVILVRKGEYAEARDILQDCLEIRRRIFGRTSIQAIGTELDITLALSAEGRAKEAIAARQKGVAYLQKELGGSDLRTIGAKNNLANLLKDAGNHEEALKLFAEVLGVRQERLGDEHPDTLSAMLNLSNVHYTRREYREAEEILDKIIPVARRVLGAKHPVTDAAVYNLAAVYTFTDRLSQAEEIFKQVVDSRTEALGASHLNTLQALNALGVIYKNQGRYDEAEAVLASLVATCSESLGHDHPATLSARSNLGSVYSNTSRWNDAEQKFEENYKIARSSFGETHPKTLLYMFNLGATYIDSSRYEEAEKVFCELVDKGEEAWGDDERSVMDARVQLAKIYREQGRVDLWLEISRKNLEVAREVYGDDHSQTEARRKSLRQALVRQSALLVEAERCRDALTIMSELTELSPDRKQAEALVALQVYLDEKDAAVGFSQQLWERAQAEESGPSPTSRWVVDALLSPHHGLDLSEITEFLKSIPAEEDGHMPRLALGLTHYRAGSFEQAVATIDTENQGPIWIRPISSFVHAMACAKSGDAESAKKSFDEAVKRMNKVAPTPTTGVELNSWEPPHWVLWCLYQGLKREASAVLEIEPPKPLAQSASEK